MEIIKDFLSVNEYSRPSKKNKCVHGIVIHWTANPMASAKTNRDFFENRRLGLSGYGSAHYIVGIKGEVIQCIPDDEVAYHVGTSLIDPKSKKVYTDEAGARFGHFCDHPNNSPNNCTIGIELCPIDNKGNFTEETLKSAAELCADICKRHGLSARDITTHHDVVGWKDCPRLWTNNPDMLDSFRVAVSLEITR